MSRIGTKFKMVKEEVIDVNAGVATTLNMAGSFPFNGYTPVPYLPQISKVLIQVQENNVRYKFKTTVTNTVGWKKAMGDCILELGVPLDWKEPYEVDFIAENNPAKLVVAYYVEVPEYDMT
jgi:hypothetical protein